MKIVSERVLEERKVLSSKTLSTAELHFSADAPRELELVLAAMFSYY